VTRDDSRQHGQDRSSHELTGGQLTERIEASEADAAELLTRAHAKAAPRRFSGEPLTGFGALA
jgi:hypothetical protein